MVPAKVTFIRYDSEIHGTQNVYGAKALLDALKFRTSGRRDSRMLYYFGAIRDDNQSDLRELYVKQHRVTSPSDAHTRIIVEQAKDEKGTSTRMVIERP